MKNMKKIFLALFTMAFVSTSVFAQSDLQVLAVVKYNKNESITVKQLKKRVGAYEKQFGKKLNLEERKDVLNTLIEEQLVVQAARKNGFNVPDSTVNQYFEANLSQLLGAPVTEKQFEEIVKKQFDLSVDEFFEKNLGFSKSEYKENLKTQLLMQQYVMATKQGELQKIVPSDEDIRMFYEAKKSSFVWKDMAELLIVAVPKGDNAGNAKIKTNELREKLVNKKINADQLKVQAKDPKAGFEALTGLVEKTEQGAMGLGLTYKSLLELFQQPENFVSDIIEADDSYQFVSIMKKYDAKMLGISDLMQPGTTITVYDYIRAGLTQQLQAQFLQQSLQQIATELNTPEYVEMKKTGADLDKLLNWGE